MMTVKGAKRAVAKLALLKYFPGDADARAALMEELPTICGSDEEAEWLARRSLELYQEWPGVNGLWQIWFSKHPPKNERERFLDQLCGITEAYPAGVPSESGRTFRDEVPMLPPADSPAGRFLAEEARKMKALPPPRRGDFTSAAPAPHGADPVALAELHERQAAKPEEKKCSTSKP